METKKRRRTPETHPSLAAILHTETRELYIGRLIIDANHVGNFLALENYIGPNIDYTTIPREKESYTNFLQSIYHATRAEQNQGTLKIAFSEKIILHEIPYKQVFEKIREIWAANDETENFRHTRALEKKLEKMVNEENPRAGEIDLSESIQKAENRSPPH